MRRQQQNSAKSDRNADLEGFCIDLLNELSRMLQLKFDIRLVNDSQHGNRDRQGNWNGLIRDILDMVSISFQKVVTLWILEFMFFIADVRRRLCALSIETND